MSAPDSAGGWPVRFDRFETGRRRRTACVVHGIRTAASMAGAVPMSADTGDGAGGWERLGWVRRGNSVHPTVGVMIAYRPLVSDVGL